MIIASSNDPNFWRRVEMEPPVVVMGKDEGEGRKESERRPRLLKTEWLEEPKHKGLTWDVLEKDVKCIGGALSA